MACVSRHQPASHHLQLLAVLSEPPPLLPTTTHHVSSVPQQFKVLLQNVDEAELSVEEQKRRKILKLLLKVKNGTPPQRKSALRQLTDKARDFGAKALFDEILPLLMAPTLEDQERHLLVKVIDRWGHLVSLFFVWWGGGGVPVGQAGSPGRLASPAMPVSGGEGAMVHVLFQATTFIVSFGVLAQSVCGLRWPWSTPVKPNPLCG